MSKKCTPLWREAHLQVKMCKTHQLRTTFVRCDVEKVHAVVARSTFASQNVQNTPFSDHFWKLRCRKSARRCGAKHISKWKCAKHHMFGPLLEVAMSKKCTPLWREAHFEVKMYKTPHVRTTFGGSDVDFRKSARRCGAKHISKSKCTKHTMFGPLLEAQMSTFEKVHAVVARSTFPSQNVQSTPCSVHFWRLRCRLSKKCTPLWREAHFQVKMYKTHHVRTTFGGSDVASLNSITLHYTTLCCTTLRYTTLHYTTLHNTTGYNYNCTTTVHYTPPLSTTLNYTTLHYTPLHSTTLQLQLQLHNYTPLHYTALHSTTLHYSTLHYTPPHSTTLQLQLHNYSTSLHYTPQHYNYTTTLHYTPLHYTSLITLHYTTLHYTTNTTTHTQLHSTTLHLQLQLHSTTLHYITLHYITLNDTAPKIDR